MEQANARKMALFPRCDGGAGMIKICKVCGQPEEDHHPFEPEMPPGCICDPWGWTDDVPPVCPEYIGDGNEYCHRCKHDAGCHAVDRGEDSMTKLFEINSCRPLCRFCAAIYDVAIDPAAPWRCTHPNAQNRNIEDHYTIPDWCPLPSAVKCICPAGPGLCGYYKNNRCEYKTRNP